MSDNPKMGRPSQRIKAKTSFDGYCPNCRENIGWAPLAELFNGRVLDSDRSQRARIVCTNTKCDSVLQVEMLIDFQLTAVE